MLIEGKQDLVVLVMDPLDDDSKLIASTLEKAGFRVTFCSTGTEISELCAGSQPAVRLIIVDPAIAGVRVSEYLSNNPSVPLMVIGSDKVLDNLPYRAFAKNFHLKKPFRRTRFLGAVLEIMSVKTSAA